MDNLEEPESPCIAVCQLDDNKVCEGCGRSMNEIMEWKSSTIDRKKQILQNCRDRGFNP